MRGSIADTIQLTLVDQDFFNLRLFFVYFQLVFLLFRLWMKLSNKRFRENFKIGNLTLSQNKQDVKYPFFFAERDINQRHYEIAIIEELCT